MPNIFNILDGQQTVVPRTAIATNTFAIPITAPARLEWMHVTYTSNATIGNRQMAIELLDSAGNILIDNDAGAVQAASLTQHYLILQGSFRESAFIAGELQVPLPFDWIMLPGHQLRFRDTANVAVGDSLVYSYSTRIP